MQQKVIVEGLENNDRDILLIAIFTFFTVMLWIFFEVLKTVKTTTISSHVSSIIVPLSTKVDTQTIDTIANKNMY